MPTPRELLQQRQATLAAEIALLSVKTPTAMVDALMSQLERINKALADPSMVTEGDDSPIAPYEIRSRMLT